MGNKTVFYGYLWGTLLIISFVLSVLKIGNYVALNSWGVVFALALFYFPIYLNSDLKISFFNLIRYKQSKKAGIIFVYSMLLGLVIEVIGSFLLKLWYFPGVKVFPYAYIGVIIFYGAFGVMVREIFLYLTKFFKSVWINTILTALTLMLLIEGIDIFTRSWIYIPVHPLIMFIGWVGLVLIFYVIPKKLKLFP